MTAVTDVTFTVNGKEPGASFYFMAGQPERIAHLEAGESFEFTLGALEYIPQAPLVEVAWINEKGERGEWSKPVQRTSS